jgi:probable HAF family extracellular repeat protein
MGTDDESRIRELMSTVDSPPSEITVADLVRDGRRTKRRRHRRWAVTGVAGAVTLGLGATVGAVNLAGGTAPAPPVQFGATGTGSRVVSCAVERLTLPAGAIKGSVNAGSPNGRFLAGFTEAAKPLAKPVLWDGTRLVPIPAGAGGEAHGVNDRGVVVGEGWTEGGRRFAWAYVDGKVIELPIPDGYVSAEATGVNAAGRISGVVFTEEGATAVVWERPLATAQVTILDSPNGAMAFGISDSGVVVGGLRKEGRSYWWDADGRGRKFVVPADGYSGSAGGVRGDWVYGSLAHPSSANDSKPPVGDSPILNSPFGESVVWDLRTGQASAVKGWVEAINSSGKVAVNHDDGAASISGTDGITVPLPDLTNSDKSWVYSLSDDGARAGGSSAELPVRWSCSEKVN